MNEILIAICEDSEYDCIHLKDYLYKSALQLNRAVQIWTFRTGTEFLEKPCPAFDMVFLNLNFPDLELNSFVDKLKYYNPQIHLVFLAPDHTTFSLGYQYGARNHIVKPIYYQIVLQEMEKYIKAEYDSCLERLHFWIAGQNGYHKLYYSRLRYIETEKRYLIFHYENHLLRRADKICDYEKKLPKKSFFRCNNSFIVNLAYISHITKEGNRYAIYLITGEKLPLSRDKYKDLRSLLYKQE